ncbi:hypothetical protein F2Q70_00021537 [Brassica cretica]|uniref:Uncharacterized protein n=1 Tax=Brassica cretica TaxID=69181 RepID=A0A3N6SBF4_BRACR|nr:hypothetical protein F2Q70_00021537 [Brassica cretica]KAF3606567.1 hypothetical protein DY000_02047842 [Brassica cretica]
MDPEFSWEARIFGFAGTVLRLPRQDYYWYLFGSRILPLGSWQLSSSYAAFYFCRKSLSDLGGAGKGVMTQVPDFAAFHVWIRRDYEHFNTCTSTCGALGTLMCPRLH